MSTNIIAHRGASYVTGEDNSLKSFAYAIEIKADYVEFDIRKTADNKLIAFHDEKIDGRNISELTYNELNEIMLAKNGYKAPLLVQVLNLCRGKIKLDIELKETGYERRVINLVTARYGYDEFMMKSFLDIVVAKVKRYDKNIKTGLLVGRRKAGVKRRFNEIFPEKRLLACNCDFVSPYFRLTTKSFIRRMKFWGYEIYVWTVNNDKYIKRFMKSGVDGIITDKPPVRT